MQYVSYFYVLNERHDRMAQNEARKKKFVSVNSDKLNKKEMFSTLLVHRSRRVPKAAK